MTGLRGRRSVQAPVMADPAVRSPVGGILQVDRRTKNRTSRKSSAYDNGLRIPLVFRWPGRIASDTVERRLVSAVDLMPTILDAAAVPMPGGRDYTGRPLLLGGTPERDFVFGSFDENVRG